MADPRRIRTLTSAGRISAADAVIFLDTSGGGFTATLPDLPGSAPPDPLLVFWSVGAAAPTVSGNVAVNGVGGGLTFSALYQGALLVPNGSGWLAFTAVSGGGGGAPTAAKYITQVPDAGLSAEQALSALSTGILKNTTGTGLLTVAVAGTDYAAASHSHGASTITGLPSATVSIPFTDGDTARRVTVTDALVSAVRPPVGFSVRRDNIADADDPGIVYLVALVTVASGSFDLLITCTDLDGDPLTEAPPNETIHVDYLVP